MKPSITGRPDGGADLVFHHEGRWVATESLTAHEADDLLAVLEQRKAMGRYCDAEDGEHACVHPPGHAPRPHLCRACPSEWPAR